MDWSRGFLLSLSPFQGLALPTCDGLRAALRDLPAFSGAGPSLFLPPQWCQGWPFSAPSGARFRPSRLLWWQAWLLPSSYGARFSPFLPLMESIDSSCGEARFDFDLLVSGLRARNFFLFVLRARATTNKPVCLWYGIPGRTIRGVRAWSASVRHARQL